MVNGMLTPGLLTTAQAAKHLGITPGALRTLAGRSPGFPRPERIGKNSIWNRAQWDPWRVEPPPRRKADTTSPCTSEASSPDPQQSADAVN